MIGANYARPILSLCLFYLSICLTEIAYFKLDEGGPVSYLELRFMVIPIAEYLAPVAFLILIAIGALSLKLANVFLPSHVRPFSVFGSLAIVVIGEISYTLIGDPTPAGIWAGVRIAFVFVLVFWIPILICNYLVLGQMRLNGES
jgi:hypothetical protein